VVSIRSDGIHSGHRRCVCNVQRGRIIRTACSGGNVEQRLVFVVRVCCDQLHQKLEVRMLCGVGIVDRRVLLYDALAATAALKLQNARSYECQIILLPV
jgi:hypothetical protein